MAFTRAWSGALITVCAALGVFACASGEEGPSGGTGGRGASAGFGGFGATGASGGSGGSSASGGSGGSGALAGTGGGFQGECTQDEVRTCYSGPTGTEGVGDCAAGTQTCTTEGYWGPCLDEVVPQTEVCNSRDDDCDGLSDEELGQTTCGMGICSVTVDNCIEGQEQTCTPGTGNPTEKCDGADDNCDGQVDEGCSCTDGATQACYTGAPATKNVGECKSGTQTCTNGKWGACTGEVLPSAEICDGLDNDCDGGAADEGNPQGGQTCDTGKKGECKNGTTACQNGTLVCQQTVSPSTEVCDGKDNSCNGTVDDGDPGGGQACSTGKPGVCAGGTTKCTGGKVVCQQNQASSTEKCDTIDNDCDGQTDEGCNCVDGQTQSCYTGAPSTQGVGPCKPGTQTCANGQWGTCVGQVLPKTSESCNGVDDDCDGTTDEGNPGGGGACTTGQSGICSAGTLTCQSGSVICKQNQNPVTEVCANGLDDNCNGQTDEGCGGCAHDKCTIGAKLTSGCDPCVTQVCAADPYCCSTDWDSLCVQEVRTVCNSLKCSESQGTCPHTLCTTGTTSQPFSSTCDSTKANCVSQVCAVDSYCCATDWDSICMDEVATVCGKNCN